MGWMSLNFDYEKEKNMRLVKHRSLQNPVLETVLLVDISDSKVPSCVVIEYPDS